ncbi:mannose-p-dolichol utilization defect 1 protein [Anaeramoeba ignava]|uniref:Mannose-p-dolichol utilization defect 1 protein n=1 Tax=Anaeramoeba ignava TaxID=1746090 RepID=A0A9Q0LWH1_ANAIG|nr:mannose-p-dolichol utilization defect 1 protein [Anaeramoeba ignava]
MNATQKFFGLISQECYEILLEQKIMDTNCLKQIISKLLGLGIVVFSVILKQISFNNLCTGKLSLISTLLAFLGTIVRLFTVIQDVKDQLLIISTVTSVVLNGILVLQFFIFSNKSEKTSDPNSQKQNSTNTPKRPRRAD